MQASRLSRLIDGLLTMLELDKASLSLIPINLKTVAQNAVDRVMETAHKAGLTLDLTASEDMIFVNGEEGYLMKAVSNLIDNAVAFTASGGRVKVTLGVTDERVDLAVSDTGIGIAPAEHQRIFERLYKVDKARTIDSGVRKSCEASRTKSDIIRICSRSTLSCIRFSSISRCSVMFVSTA